MSETCQKFFTRFWHCQKSVRNFWQDFDSVRLNLTSPASVLLFGAGGSADGEEEDYEQTFPDLSGLMELLQNILDSFDITQDQITVLN